MNENADIDSLLTLIKMLKDGQFPNKVTVHIVFFPLFSFRITVHIITSGWNKAFDTLLFVMFVLYMLLSLSLNFFKQVKLSEVYFLSCNSYTIMLVNFSLFRIAADDYCGER